MIDTCARESNLVLRARAHLRSAESKCHGLWDNQKPDATFAASGFLKRMRYGQSRSQRPHSSDPADRKCTWALGSRLA